MHLRHRPESGGAIVYLQKTGQGDSIEGHVSDTVLNSQAVATSFATNNSYFLLQAFPEGSPTHPAYPTGHGTVGGACITALKFFFDGNYVITNPLVPPPDPTRRGGRAKLRRPRTHLQRTVQHFAHQAGRVGRDDNKSVGPGWDGEQFNHE